MNRTEKETLVEQLRDEFSNSTSYYFTDASTLTVEQVNILRRTCFNRGIKMQVAKNTLIKKALEALEGDYSELYPHLVGPTAIMFTNEPKLTATTIKDFRKNNPKPALKVAYVDSAVFVGDEQLEALTKLKSKEELIGEIIHILQSPAKTVIGQLKSGGQKIAGVLKTLSEKEK